MNRRRRILLNLKKETNKEPIDETEIEQVKEKEPEERADGEREIFETIIREANRELEKGEKEANRKKMVKKMFINLLKAKFPTVIEDDDIFE